MLGRYRNAMIIAVGSVVLAIAYGGLAETFGYRPEWAGVTMLIALGVALGLMVAVLDTGEGS